MTQAVTVVVEELGSRTVNTKFGAKQTYSFKASGDWYSTGFKQTSVMVGDVISFEFKEDKFGKQADAATVAKGATRAGAVAAAPSRPSFIPEKTYSPSGGRVFPIPALDASRAINRQNALTNARELVTSCNKPGTYTPNSAVDLILSIARLFEAYTTGDLDLEEVEAENFDRAITTPGVE